MEEYLESNKEHWSQGYNAPNVDHSVFRFYGRVLRPDFQLPKESSSLLDFGCGQGAAVNFFHMNGFHSHGVDISSTDLEVAKVRYPHIQNNFHLVSPDPQENKAYGPRAQYTVITAIQSLYYFSQKDFNIVLKKLYDQLEKGGVFFCTMMSSKCEEYYSNSSPTEDPWLRKVEFRNSRLELKEYYMFFVEDEKDLASRFPMFKMIHTGYYCGKFRSDEGDGFHYTYCGVKE